MDADQNESLPFMVTFCDYSTLYTGVTTNVQSDIEQKSGDYTMQLPKFIALPGTCPTPSYVVTGLDPLGSVEIDDSQLSYYQITIDTSAEPYASSFDPIRFSLEGTVPGRSAKLTTSYTTNVVDLFDPCTGSYTQTERDAAALLNPDSIFMLTSSF